MVYQDRTIIMPDTPMLPPPMPPSEPPSEPPKVIKQPNSITFFLDPPYGLDLEIVQALPEVERSEITTWVNGDRYLACKLYRNRTKIKDMSLIAWLFMSLSWVARTKPPQISRLPAL